MKAYSMDLRRRIVAAREAGESVVSVARRFEVCTKTVYHYCAQSKRGELAPRPLPGRTPLLSPAQTAVLVALLQENPSLTLEEMGQKWHEESGQRVARSTLHDALRRAGMRFKKKRV